MTNPSSTLTLPGKIICAIGAVLMVLMLCLMVFGAWVTLAGGPPRRNYLIDFDQDWVRTKSFPDDQWEIWHSTNLVDWSPCTNVPLTVRTVLLANLQSEYFRTRVTNTFTGWTSAWAVARK